MTLLSEECSAERFSGESCAGRWRLNSEGDPSETERSSGPDSGWDWLWHQVTSQEHRGPRLRASWEKPQVGAGERTVATHLTLEPEDNPLWLLAIVLDIKFSELVTTVPSRDRQSRRKWGVGARLTLPLPPHETPCLSPGLGGFVSLGHSLGLLPVLLHHLNHSTQPWFLSFSGVARRHKN